MKLSLCSHGTYSPKYIPASCKPQPLAGKIKQDGLYQPQMDQPASEIALACLGSGVTDAGTPADVFLNTSVGHSMQPTCLDGDVKDLTEMWQRPRPNSCETSAGLLDTPL